MAANVFKLGYLYLGAFKLNLDVSIKLVCLLGELGKSILN